MSLMACIGGKSTGWSGPLDDSVQDLQENPLRLNLIAQLTMNYSLTTTICPQDIPINCVSMERYQTGIEKKLEGKNVKGRKRPEEIKTDTETVEKECGYSFLK